MADFKDCQATALATQPPQLDNTPYYLAFLFQRNLNGMLICSSEEKRYFSISNKLLGQVARRKKFA